MPLEEAAEPLVRLIRSFRPHVLTTYDENGGYPHPDHIKCHEISVHAFEAAADPDRYPDAGEPWQVSKLYYHLRLELPADEGDRGRHRAPRARATRTPSTGTTGSAQPEDDARLTTRVECAEYFHVRDEALLAHATQIDPNGYFFSVPREVLMEAWPTEDFQLVTSHVETSHPGGRPLRRARADSASAAFSQRPTTLPSVSVK